MSGGGGSSPESGGSSDAPSVPKEASNQSDEIFDDVSVEDIKDEEEII
jgi:hypothetical protein